MHPSFQKEAFIKNFEDAEEKGDEVPMIDFPKIITIESCMENLQSEAS